MTEDAQEYNLGHLIEGYDRCHTIVVMINELLNEHPAIIKSGQQWRIDKALEFITDAYQGLSVLDKD